MMNSTGYIKFGLVVLVLFFSFFTTVFSQDEKTGNGTILVHIRNIKNNKGQVNVNLFNKEDGFPGNYKKAYKIIRTVITDTNNILVEFSNLEYGNYAIAIIHDEDLNNELKTGLFGKPLEGYGFSNNVKGLVGPPDYKEAIIHLDTNKLELSILMNY
jgi:uncharacterized protein (DUF2141 family)